MVRDSKWDVNYLMEITVLIEGVHNDLGPIEGTNVINSINPICSSVTLLKDEKNILVDTGFRGFDKEILTCLNNQGLNREDIDFVFNTHAHFDHCFNNFLFSNAKIVFGSNLLHMRKFDVHREIIIPNVSILKTPGHYPDHQSLIVEKDAVYVIAGDALREDIIRDEKKWNSMNEEYIQSVKRIFSVADNIIPGHGRLIDRSIIKELKKIIESRS
jgi:glyoxylase-like metal-dependent hydrolase (beta-lactamase superfamily II)